MTYNHIGNEETVRNDLNRGAATQGLDHKLFHVIQQLSHCAQDIPCMILRDVTQPAVVRFFELEPGPREGGLG